MSHEKDLKSLKEVEIKLQKQLKNKAELEKAKERINELKEQLGKENLITRIFKHFRGY
jgi:tRNA U34 5-carboxymethylaminomethyl modifying GTPase MnmE/TrmE